MVATSSCVSRQILPMPTRFLLLSGSVAILALVSRIAHSSCKLALAIPTSSSLIDSAVGEAAGMVESQRAKGKQHSHVASITAFAAPVFTQDVALPPPSSSTITSFGPSGSMMSQTVYQSPSTTWVDGVYPSINQVLSLLECMDVNLTIQ